MEWWTVALFLICLAYLTVEPITRRLDKIHRTLQGIHAALRGQDPP